MKEQTLVEMKNKIETIGQVLQRLVFENENLRTMAVGNHRLLKKLPGFEEAFEELKAEAEEELKAAEEVSEEEVMEALKDETPKDDADGTV